MKNNITASKNVERNNMTTPIDISEKWYMENQEFVKRYVIDEEGLLSKECRKKGTYLVSVKLIEENILIPMYAGEAGADKNHDRSIGDRLKEHLRIWFGDYTEYWTGVSKAELITGKVKFVIGSVGESDDLGIRKELESQTIMKEHPYLQYGPYKKYDSDYDEPDLCIIPFKGTRRKAFLSRLKQDKIEYEDSPKCIDFIRGGNIKSDWKQLAIKGSEFRFIRDVIRAEFEESPEKYDMIKKNIDNAVGFEIHSRGCTFPYIVRLITRAFSKD